MLCPLCGERRAKRTCPALGKQICAVCCGTKRLTEIQCPSDCSYLAIAREHPAAAVARRQQRDVALVVRFMRDFSERQSQLFSVVATFLARYQPQALHTVIDEDAAEGAGALAATFDTASRGVIYEHRAASLPAERLAAALKPVLAEAAGSHAGAAFERDAAVVLRRVQEAAADMRASEPGNPRALLELFGRVVRPADTRVSAGTPREVPLRLILP